MPHDLATEHRIMAAARKVFQSKGLNGARMQEIADTAGINKALLHYYFRNKEKLFAAVFQEAIEEFIPAIFRVWQTTKPFEQKLTDFVSLYIDTLLEKPFLPAFILHEVNQNPKKLQSMMTKEGAPLIGELVLAQINAELKKNKVRSVDARQVMVNMMACCVFPFAGRPILMAALGMKEKEYAVFLEGRKKLIPSLILDTMKPRSP
jgi:AcrR family transcriptional regulator